MTHDDMRRQTSLIVRRGNEYLIGYSGVFLRWSGSTYDAWRTRDKRAAQMVADKVGGMLVLFNPITGQTKDMAKKGG
jgi:hypothetical protein